jgi:hypothetical protein
MHKLVTRVLVLVGLLATVAGCAEPTTSDLTSRYTILRRSADGIRFTLGGSRSASAVIGAAGGTLQVGGNKIVFPAGALSSATTITMTEYMGTGGVEMQPHGLTFPAAARPELTLSYAGIDVSGYDDLVIAYQVNGTITEVYDTDEAGYEALSARVPHFSGFIVAGN